MSGHFCCCFSSEFGWFGCSVLFCSVLGIYVWVPYVGILFYCFLILHWFGVWSFLFFFFFAYEFLFLAVMAWWVWKKEWGRAGGGSCVSFFVFQGLPRLFPLTLFGLNFIDYDSSWLVGRRWGNCPWFGLFQRGWMVGRWICCCTYVWCMYLMKEERNWDLVNCWTGKQVGKVDTDFGYDMIGIIYLDYFPRLYGWFDWVLDWLFSWYWIIIIIYLTP